MPCQGGILARRRSLIPVLTGFNVEQLRSCDERRYHSAKPPTGCEWTLLRGLRCECELAAQFHSGDCVDIVSGATTVQLVVLTGACHWVDAARWRRICLSSIDLEMRALHACRQSSARPLSRADGPAPSE